MWTRDVVQTLAGRQATGKVSEFSGRSTELRDREKTMLIIKDLWKYRVFRGFYNIISSQEHTACTPNVVSVRQDTRDY